MSVRIDDLHVQPTRVTAGCPVTVSMVVDGAAGGVARIWVVPHLSRSAMAPDPGPYVLKTPLLVDAPIPWRETRCMS